MLPVLDSEAMREADRHTIEDLGVPGLELMENAASGVVDATHWNSTLHSSPGAHSPHGSQPRAGTPHCIPMQEQVSTHSSPRSLHAKPTGHAPQEPPQPLSPQTRLAHWGTQGGSQSPEAGLQTRPSSHCSGVWLQTLF